MPGALQETWHRAFLRIARKKCRTVRRLYSRSALQRKVPQGNRQKGIHSC